MASRKTQESSLTSGIDAVDALLDSLVDSGAKDSDESVNLLRQALVRPGRLHDWAVRATPKLVVACTKKSAGRGPILRLLADIAVFGVHTWWLDDGYDVRGPWFDEVVEDHPAKVTHLAVEAGLATYLTILQTGAPDERMGAAFVLAFLSRQAEASATAVRASAADDANTPEVRATAFITLGYLEKYLGDGGTDLEQAHRRQTDPLLQLATTIALAKAKPAALNPDDLGLLRRAGSEASRWNSLLPWCDGHLNLLAMLTLGKVAFSRGDVGTLEQLTQEGASTELAAKLAVLLCDAALGVASDRPTLIADAGRAPRAQRHVIELLIDLRLVHAADLERRGVFGSHYALLRYLGRTEQGPLDAVVDGEAVWRTFFEQVRNGEDDAAFAERVTRDRSPEDIVALAMDMAFSVYTTYPPLPPSTWGGDDRAYHARIQQLSSLVVARSSTEAVERALLRESKSADVYAKAAALITGWHALTGGAPLPETVDALVVAAMQLAYRDVVLPVLAALPQARREQVLLKAGFGLRKTGGREVELVGAWAFAESCPTKAVLEAAILAVDSSTEKLPEKVVCGVLAKLAPALPALLKRAALRNSPRKPLFQAALDQVAKA